MDVSTIEVHSSADHLSLDKSIALAAPLPLPHPLSPFLSRKLVFSLISEGWRQPVVGDYHALAWLIGVGERQFRLSSMDPAAVHRIPISVVRDIMRYEPVRGDRIPGCIGRHRIWLMICTYTPLSSQPIDTLFSTPQGSSNPCDRFGKTKTRERRETDKNGTLTICHELTQQELLALRFSYTHQSLILSSHLMFSARSAIPHLHPFPKKSSAASTANLQRLQVMSAKWTIYIKGWKKRSTKRRLLQFFC